MERNFLIQLTNSLYQLTLLFPKKEPLRYKMRELADDILADPSDEKLDILASFFEVAKAQNWVSQDSLLAVQEEYGKLKRNFFEEAESDNGFTESPNEEETVNESNGFVAGLRNGLAERQEAILNFLKIQGRAQVWQISRIFPQVSKRTIRRDVEQMFNQGIIERIGERNETFYQLRREA